MRLLDNQTDAASLATLGKVALSMLCSGNIGALTNQFGYALGFDRDNATAVRDDLASCLAALNAVTLSTSIETSEPIIKYFEPNDSGLFAIIECLALADNGAEVLVELVVTSKGVEKHVTLEQISAAV